MTPLRLTPPHVTPHGWMAMHVIRGVTDEVDAPVYTCRCRMLTISGVCQKHVTSVT